MKHCPNCGFRLPQEKPKITLVRAVQTCWACPSQWDAYDADGNYYYLRYRFGSGTVDKDGTEVARFSTGDALDGSISLEEFARLAGLELTGELS